MGLAEQCSHAFRGPYIRKCHTPGSNTQLRHGRPGQNQQMHALQMPTLWPHIKAV